MKRVIMMAAASSMLLLAGCNADGLEFNGAQQVEQFPVRKIPVVHYQPVSYTHLTLPTSDLV